MIVETMGYADVGYRERKQRIHHLTSQSLSDTPDVEHDFHLPIDPALFNAVVLASLSLPCNT